MEPSGSFFINRATAAKAVSMSLPMIEAAIQDQAVCGSGCLHIVIMDPARNPANSAFHDAILHEHSIGDRTRWDADYAGFARAKARVAWRTGMDGHMVQELRPYMLIAGDTILWGSITLDGIVVSASGAHPWYDEAFAGTVAMCLRAIAMANIHEQRGKNLFLLPE